MADITDKSKECKERGQRGVLVYNLSPKIDLVIGIESKNNFFLSIGDELLDYQAWLKL